MAKIKKGPKHRIGRKQKRSALYISGTPLFNEIHDVDDLKDRIIEIETEKAKLEDRIQQLQSLITLNAKDEEYKSKIRLFKKLLGDTKNGTIADLMNQGYIAYGVSVSDDKKKGTRTYMIPGYEDKPLVKLIRDMNGENGLVGRVVVGNSMKPFSLSEDQVVELVNSMREELVAE